MCLNVLLRNKDESIQRKSGNNWQNPDVGIWICLREIPDIVASLC